MSRSVKLSMSYFKSPIRYYCVVLSIFIIIFIFLVYHNVKPKNNSRLIRIKVDGKWGYSDDRGNIVIPIQFDDACPFSEGLARVTRNQKSGYINPAGNIIIDLKYDEVLGFIGGLAPVKIKGKCYN